MASLVLVLVALLSLCLAVVLAGTACPLGYIACPNGSCTQFPELQCSVCTAGQLVCPDGRQCAAQYEGCGGLLPFQNWTLSVAERVADVVSRLTVDEKVLQLMNSAPAVPRLGIAAYNFRDEAIHGVGRAGLSTVFPQVVGMAATFDVPLVREMTRITALEGRAIYNKALREGQRQQYLGVTFYGPNINLARDPRWGRVQEVPGECPYLSGKYAAAFVDGMQRNATVPQYVQALACCKHWAAYSLDVVNATLNRFNFDAVVSPRDLAQSYFAQFRRCIAEGRPGSVMCSYNSLNGVPACADQWLLDTVLRQQLRFDGFVVTDYDAIKTMYVDRHYTATLMDAALLGLDAGVDQNGGTSFHALLGAARIGRLNESSLDRAVANVFAARIRLGFLDPPDVVPFNAIAYDVVASAPHTAAALQAARESIVLLRNGGSGGGGGGGGGLLLPWSGDAFASIAVIGPNANATQQLLGNYQGTPPAIVSILAGVLSHTAAATRVLYSPGCHNVSCVDDALFADAEQMAAAADALLLVLGLDQSLEAEMLDRTNITLPGLQEALLQRLVPPALTAGKAVALVLVNGGTLAIPWAAANVPCIVEAWYPGEQGGNAVADVLFGAYNPAGRLPVTVYTGLEQLPPYTSMNMSDARPGRTYRYIQPDQPPPLWPFGHGLSYTNFSYAAGFAAPPPPATVAACGNWTATVLLQNTGNRTGDEVVQLYLRWPQQQQAPVVQLAAFARAIAVAPGQQVAVQLEVDYWSMALAQADGTLLLLPGTIAVFIGGGQPKYYDGGISAQFELVAPAGGQDAAQC